MIAHRSPPFETVGYDMPSLTGLKKNMKEPDLRAEMRPSFAPFYEFKKAIPSGS